MKEEGDVFKKFRDSFGRMRGHFHILEQQVPVETQMQYFRSSEAIRLANKQLPAVDEAECEKLQRMLIGEELPVDEKQICLSRLAASRLVKAYRILEAYAENPAPDVKDWAYMALMECRISLESEFSDEKQIYISTGLGGRDEKLRFFVLLTSRRGQAFEAYQKQVVERETAYALPKAGCEIERLTVGERHVELVCLFPVRADIKAVFDGLINECNEYGHFLSDTFVVTNVKELSAEEIAEIIEKNGNSKTSD